MVLVQQISPNFHHNNELISLLEGRNIFPLTVRLPKLLALTVSVIDGQHGGTIALPEVVGMGRIVKS